MHESTSEMRERLINDIISKNSFRARISVKIKIVLWEITLFLSYFIKRAIDVTASLIGLILISPIFIITTIAIRLESKGAVLYTQIRVGKNGRHFKVYKFRSMFINADKIKKELISKNESGDGVIFKMKRDPRITRLGKIIRKFSIDELPQLFNVLQGNMSLVGPRPPVPSEVAQYTLEERKRLDVKPGITCIWQVSGRSDIPFSEQVELDKEYIKSKSILNDLFILIKTIPAVLTGRGAY